MAAATVVGTGAALHVGRHLHPCAVTLATDSGALLLTGVQAVRAALVHAEGSFVSVGEETAELDRPYPGLVLTGHPRA